MDLTIKGAISRLITDARLSDDQERKRSDLFDRFMGEPYGDEQSGRSRFVSTDVSDAIESFLPDVLEPFLGSDNVVQFEPVSVEDEAAARQETDVVRHVFWRMNDGFTNVYTVMKEALTQQNAYFKQGWQEKEKVTIQKFRDLTPDELFAIVQDLDGEYEFQDVEGLEEGRPILAGAGPDGALQFQPISLTIRCVKVEEVYDITCIPQEEFFCTPGWHQVDLQGIPCCGHRREIEKGELRRMGFLEESIVSAGGDESDGEQKEGRNDTQDFFAETDDEGGDDSTSKVMVYEAYCRVDINDDGRAELVKVWTVGDGSKILQWKDGTDAIEEVSDIPFEAFTPYPVPHRHVGRSLAEQVDDIAHVKTALFRTTLDNVYSTQYARPVVAEAGATPNTYQDLASPNSGAPVRVKDQTALRWERPPSIIDATLPLLMQFNDVREERVGATRYNQGLDADSLNKTATGISKIMDASMKRRQIIARIFANTLRGVFLRIHRDFRGGPLRDMSLKLNNEFLQVNPRSWKERTDMVLNVGMGSGDRDTRRAGLMLLGQTLEKMATDPEIRAAGLIGYPQFKAVADEVMRTFDFENIDRFMPPPEAARPPQKDQGPSPQEQMMQMQMAERQMQHQLAMQKMAIEQAKLQASVMNDQQKLDLERKKAVMDDDFKRDKLEVDALTGFHRADTRRVQSAPPVSYPQVMNG